MHFYPPFAQYLVSIRGANTIVCRPSAKVWLCVTAFQIDVYDCLGNISMGLMIVTGQVRVVVSFGKRQFSTDSQSECGPGEGTTKWEKGRVTWHVRSSPVCHFFEIKTREHIVCIEASVQRWENVRH